MIPLLALLGCSLSTYEYAPCETHAECRDAFGFGSVCGEDGLCADVEPGPRCEAAWPEDLFARLDNYRDAIAIGALFDLPSDTPESQAAQLAVMQVDDAAGLDGRPFVLAACTYAEDLAYDDLSLEDAAAAGAGFLAETLGVPAIVGPATSSTAEAAYHVAAAAGAVVISPSATSPALTTIDGEVKSDVAPGFFWRTAAPDSLQGEVAAGDMIGRGVLDVAVIYRVGSYGEGFAQVFAAEFATGGGTANFAPFSDDTERTMAIVGAKDAHPGEVLFISSEPADIVAFLNAAREYEEFESIGIFLTDTARDQEVLDDAAAAADLFDQVRGTAPFVRTEGVVYDLFQGAYAGAFAPASATDSVYTAHTWDAAWLAIHGVAWSAANEGGISGLGVARGLRRISNPDAAPIAMTSWDPVREAFALGLPVNLDGASGALDYDPVTEETTAPIEVWRVEAGTFQTDYTIDP